MMPLSELKLGLQEEQYVVSTETVNFYTCIVGPFRVYVWGSFDRRLVQAERMDARLHYYYIEEQFNNSKGPILHCMSDDPLTLLGIIHHITSEGNNNANPTGATDGVLALHLS